MLKILLVAVGGGIGAVSRYLLSLWAADRYGSGFPYGTLLANIIGCFIIGIFMTLITEKYVVSPYWRLLVTVGFIGGLTTFSSFSYETLKLLQEANVAGALWNLLLNMVVGFAATWLGISAGRML
jgi:CrcB protein